MATWTLVGSGLTVGTHLASDGTYIYYTSSANTTDIYKFDPATGTETLIADSSSWTDGASPDVCPDERANLVYLNGNLYAPVKHTGEISIYQYSGGGTAWTSVLNIAMPGDASNIFITLFSADSSYMALIYKIDGGASTGFAGKHSTNGTIWDTSSGIVAAALSYDYSGLTIAADFAPALAITANVYTGPNYQTHKFNAGTWASVETMAGVSEYHRTSDGLYYWKFNGTDYQYTTDFSTYTTPTNTDIEPWQSVNMPFPVGVDLNTVPVDDELYIWDTDTGQWNVAADGMPFGVSLRGVVRLTSGMTYVVLPTEIYERDAPIDPPVTTNARFYFAPSGQALAKKFTLPFPGVAPNAIAIDRILGTVVIGSDRPAADPVIYSTYPYATGTVTDSGFPTGTSVQALRWV